LVDLDSLRAFCHQIELLPSLQVLSPQQRSTKCGGFVGRKGRKLRKTQSDTIFIQSLPRNVTREDLQTVFSQIEVIKIDTKTRLPKILIYKDTITGDGKGETTITYEDEEAAQAIINWYNRKEFLSNIIEISLATQRVQTFSRRNGYRGRGGARGTYRDSFRGDRSNRY